MKNEITFIDPFAGIGGFRLGLEKANDTITERAQQGVQQGSKNNPATVKSFLGTKQFTCVWSNEWDKYCAKIYQKNFKEVPDTRDIRTVPSREIPDHDLLCAGFPCPTFSIAGKGKGFEDTRGAVFFEIPRILRDKRPRYFLLENVKGLLSHQAGETFQTILGVLSDLGYRVEWQVLNSKHFGVPQNRERVFIVGHLRGESGQEVFPVTQSSQGNLIYSAGVISARQKWLKEGKNYSREFSQGQRIYSAKGISQTLAGNAGGQGGKTGLYQIGEKGVARCLDSNYCKGRTNHPQRTMVVDGQIRKLTPVECERLQGFPDNWTEGVSDTQRYKMLGNAVTVNVVEAIGRRIRKVLNES